MAAGYELSIDLQTQEVTIPGGVTYAFEIDPGLKEKMLKGMDDIDLTLAEQELIETFEAGHREAQPWLFMRNGGR